MLDVCTTLDFASITTVEVVVFVTERETHWSVVDDCKMALEIRGSNKSNCTPISEPTVNDQGT